METSKDWLFVVLYVTSGNIPGAKLFHTEKDFDDMPREIHEAGYGGWGSGWPWGCMQVETFEEAKIRLNKLLQAKSEDFEDVSLEICFNDNDFVISDKDKLSDCYVWWTNDNNGSTPFVSCLKNESEFCQLDGWFCDMMDKYDDDDIKDRICRGDMEGSTSCVYTASQIEEDACIQEELMS